MRGTDLQIRKSNYLKRDAGGPSLYVRLKNMENEFVPIIKGNGKVNEVEEGGGYEHEPFVMDDFNDDDLHVCSLRIWSIQSP